MTTKLVELLYQSWTDLDKSIDGLSDAEAAVRQDGCNRIAWCFGHVSQQVESWFNRKFQGLPPHRLLSQDLFHTGASGEAPDLSAIREATAEVRDAARLFLDALDADELEQPVPYDGPLLDLRKTGLSPSYALLRCSAHHFIHVGEISTVRFLLGNPVEESASCGEVLMPRQ